MPGFSRQGAMDASLALDILTVMGSQFNSTALLNAALTAGLMTGAMEVYLTTTANGANALTTRSANQLYADLQAAFGLQNVNGMTFDFQITNSGNNTVTLTAGSGITLTGTMTILTNTCRTFCVTVTSPNAITIQNTGSGTN